MNINNIKLDKDERMLLQSISKAGVHPYIKYFLLVFPIMAMLLAVPGLYLSITGNDKIVINRALTKEEIAKDSLDFIRKTEADGLEITPGIGQEFSINHSTEKELVYPNYIYFLKKESIKNIIENTPYTIAILTLLISMSLFMPIIYYVNVKKPSYNYIFTDKRIIQIDKEVCTSYYWNIFIPEIKTFNKNIITLTLKICYYVGYRRNQSSYNWESLILIFDNIDEVKSIIENNIKQSSSI